MRSETGWAMRSRSSCAPRDRCVRCALGVGLARPKRSNSHHLVPVRSEAPQTAMTASFVPIKLRGPDGPRYPLNRRAKSSTRRHKRRLTERTPPAAHTTSSGTSRSSESPRLLRQGHRSYAANEPFQPPVGRNTTQSTSGPKHKDSQNLEVKRPPGLRQAVVSIKLHHAFAASGT
jgi:hypothetical protein